MLEKGELGTSHCPVEITLRVIGGRWKVLIIHFLLEDRRRFGELLRSLGGVSARTLSKQLRELEEDGVIGRQDYQESPPKVEYFLTPLGKTLRPLLMAMEQWGMTIQEQRSTKRTRH
jgi:DNA-binding HxlR family transcriptional regulator